MECVSNAAFILLPLSWCCSWSQESHSSVAMRIPAFRNCHGALPQLPAKIAPLKSLLIPLPLFLSFFHWNATTFRDHSIKNLLPTWTAPNQGQSWTNHFQILVGKNSPLPKSAFEQLPRLHHPENARFPTEQILNSKTLVTLPQIKLLKHVLQAFFCSPVTPGSAWNWRNTQSTDQMHKSFFSGNFKKLIF